MKNTSVALTLVLAFAGGCLACFWPDLFAAYSSREQELAAAPDRPLPALTDIPRFQAVRSVAASYAAIPHRRTEFDERQATMPRVERAYLRLMFGVIDQAIALRVETQRRFSSGEGDREACLDAARRLIVFADQIPPPRRLAGYHRDVTEAMTSQLDFLARWHAAGRGFVSADPRRIGEHGDVRRASRALHRAYDALMQAYPAEGAHNRDAFFDYHCALDFL